MKKLKVKNLILGLFVILIILAVGIFATTVGNPSDDNNAGNITDIKADSEADIITETPYCNLHYPGKWEDVVLIENSSNNPYIVDYYGVLGGEKYLLFSLVFGESEGFCLGTFSTEDGNVEMHIVEGALDNIDDYSDEDQSMLYDMQINVNYIIQNLEKDKSFKIS